MTGDGLVTIDGREHYAVTGIDRMPPFLMSVVSDGDRWMFASSTGALTAGRRDASRAVFPYETDDRLHAAGGRIGPVTAVTVGGTRWRPFGPYPGTAFERGLAKSVLGDRLVLDERAPELGLTFRFTWASCERFGFVRTATLENVGPDAVTVDLVDGLVDLLPSGLDPTTTQRLSNLANAYKRSEVVDDAGRLALFTLESPVSDRAEPEEVLRATSVWSTGLVDAALTLDVTALDADVVEPVSLVTGRPGAYLLAGTLSLLPGERRTWRLVVDAARDHVDVAELLAVLHDTATDVDDLLVAETDAASDHLRSIMARADALQCTGDAVAAAHHLANVTYNVMRGGVPLDGYRVHRDELRRYLGIRNRSVSERHDAALAALPTASGRRDVLEWAGSTGDVHLLRLVREYLPFSFARRHGDPSRPWNKFSIRVRDDAGDPIVHYEGNWRDVFQNWEALCATHPEYLPGVVSVFANASTADGFNPYRITTEGIDWEVPDPDDPWANIGYWGDHQLVYLLRLLRATDQYLPGAIDAMLTERSFTFADVPYRLAPYDELVADPKATIEYDADAAARSDERVGRLGGDGRLLVGPDGEPATVTLLEKLVITTLARLSNFVPGGGIWMNTQRPEWNDANNALVGWGLSMVTTCHLRAFLAHLDELARRASDDVEMAPGVASWLRDVQLALRELPVADPADESSHRRRVMDALGGAFSDYRTSLYERAARGDAGGDAGADDGAVTVTRAEIAELCRLALAHVDRTIREQRRPDGLVHSYQLLALSEDGTRAEVRRLPEMLEGQVAALGAGVFAADELADLVDALFDSALYRSDRDTFMLAPERRLPSFLDKNLVPSDEVANVPLLVDLLAAGDRSVVRRDAAGAVRFHPDLVDAPRLDAALDALGPRWTEQVTSDRVAVAALYERVFHHRSFIGRSGSMYAYEGIGSIYWHMVTKLVLAVQEAALDARRSGAPDDVVERLVRGYTRVRAGLGHHQSAQAFGAVPTDPYSHTPRHAGAQQPGMTGAVKEELLARPLELGFRVEDGELVTDPLLHELSEPLADDRSWSVVDVDGATATIDLPAGSWGFTCCQVPIVAAVAADTSDGPSIEVVLADGAVERIAGRRLGRALSAEVFGRSGRVRAIRASI